MDDLLSEDVAERTPFHVERRAEPCVMVLFGATGDLAKRKLIPGLYNLHKDQLLPEHFAVVGVGRSVGTLDQFRALQKETTTRFSRTKLDPGSWAAFEKKIDYVRGDVDDPQTYADLAKACVRADQTQGTSKNRLYCM